VAWLANHLASIGRGLLRGDVVITGSLITTKAVTAGDFVEFSLGQLGKIELRVD
jgi:2-keto-4-pentenoate hydratase